MTTRYKLLLTLAVIVTVITMLLVPVPAHAGNVTQPLGKDPTTLIADQYECSLTNPQYTINAGAENGFVKLYTRPGTPFMDVNKPGSGGWNDAYESAGVNPAGYDSTRCDNWGYGKSYKFPVALSDTGSINIKRVTMHTVHGFAGDGGVDMWISPSTGTTDEGVPWNSGWVTSKMLQHSKDVTEIMVWLNSPGIWRNQYRSLGWVTISTRTWQVLYYTSHSARHPWNYIVFAAPLATSRTITFTDRNLALSPLIQYAASKGWVTNNALLQNVDVGFEWYRSPVGGTQVRDLELTDVG